MKVILLIDVAKVGRKHEVKDVADGFARNVLLARHLAVLATPAAIAQVERERAGQAAELAKEEGNFADLAKALRGASLTISAKAGAGGHLFASIKADQIIAAAKSGGLTIKKEWVAIPATIKSVGEHQFEIKRGGKSEKVSVKIMAS